MTLDTLPDIVHQGLLDRCRTEHLDQQRRACQVYVRESQRTLGERRALLIRQAVEKAAMARHGTAARLLTGLRHGWQRVALAVRTAVGWSGLDRREAVDFVAQERLHAWDEGFRLPY
jgi:hypothetical protein